MANIYELAAEYQQFMQMLVEDPTNEELQNLFEIAADDLEEKAENYAKMIRNLESDIAGAKAEENRIKENRQAWEKSVDRLKDNLKAVMIATGKRKFKHGNFSFNIQKNGGALPVIVDVPTEELPDDLVIITEKPNLKAIADYINETGDITQFHFGERGESLRIK